MLIYDYANPEPRYRRIPHMQTSSIFLLRKHQASSSMRRQHYTRSSDIRANLKTINNCLSHGSQIYAAAFRVTRHKNGEILQDYQYIGKNIATKFCCGYRIHDIARDSIRENVCTAPPGRKGCC